MAPANATRASSNRIGKHRSSGDDYAAIASVHLKYACPTSGPVANAASKNNAPISAGTSAPNTLYAHPSETPANDIDAAAAPSGAVAESHLFDQTTVPSPHLDEEARSDLRAKHRALIVALARQAAQRRMAQLLAGANKG